MKSLKTDILSGFVIFLIALPLSVGIALAAGVPASAGIVSAILGGLLGTFCTGAHIVINGPAAGLIVVILSAVRSLSDGDPLLGFKRTLAAVMVAGALQAIFGLLKLGRLAFLAPSAVIRGMLSAIGVIIIIKQIPVALGASPQAKNLLSMIAETPQYFYKASPPIALIGGLGLIVLIFWNRFSGKIKKALPGPLVVVALGLLFSLFLNIGSEMTFLFGRAYTLGSSFLVQVPTNIKELIIFPSFDIVFSTKSLIAILTIFIVCSIESLLSAHAVDKLDPLKRKTDLNKDLLGKGIVNLCCGALGGYPIIAEIVRSSANIDSGAQTKWSNFFHGFFILVFVALFPELLNLIPLAALAAVLLVVGFNLAHPRHFIEVYQHGKDQFLFFMITLTVTLAEDLLLGIFAGILCKIISQLIRGVRPKDFIHPRLELVEGDQSTTLKFQSPATFLGYLKVQKILQRAGNKKVQIDFNGQYVDYTIRELLIDSGAVDKLTRQP